MKLQLELEIGEMFAIRNALDARMKLYQSHADKEKEEDGKVCAATKTWLDSYTSALGKIDAEIGKI